MVEAGNFDKLEKEVVVHNDNLMIFENIYLVLGFFIFCSIFSD